MQQSRVIDLEVPSPWGLRVPAGRRRRGPALVGLSVLLVLLLTGPAHIGPALTLAWRAEAFQGFLWLDEDTAYSGTRTADGLRLVARDVATGRVRWEYRLNGSLAESYLGEPTILVPRFPPYPGSPATTLVLDARTARQLGSYPVPAAPVAYFGEGVAVMVDREPGPPTGPDSPDGSTIDGWQEAHRATAVDLVTGETIWDRRLPAGSFWALPGVYPWMEGFVGTAAPGRWMAVVGSDGAAEVMDLHTGRVTARTRLGPFDSWSYAIALPEVLVVNSQAWPEMVLTGYNPQSLSMLWRIQLPGVPDPSAWPIECAGLVCMVSPYSVWGIDPEAGALVWRQRAVEVYAAGFRMLAAITFDGPVLVDVATGDARSVGGGWRIVEKQPRGRELVVSRVERERTELGVLDQDSSRITVLGDVGHIGSIDGCHTTGTHLACTVGDEMRVWRIRR